ncbi:uncharacterized protein BDZ99DRAFT_464069 [Mytilinidion resinicola]|uniref:YDG domain-containing protein n=1 Tax=Mytilinidion resinicola TaxID=574789 RepID=A0A6A6YI19_9PEZI|nr:uncharacterized protein BDZ99DRAFT_464069 [Mytilinidion resinicola]KAF2808173.1 hypothetical protein BDZ99DRAFT_464069 [Mytilinidion resinicola]
MDYDYYEDMARRRKAFRAKWPEQSPSPPPPEVPQAAQPIHQNMAHSFENYIDLSSPESIPQSPPPQNPLKRPRTVQAISNASPSTSTDGGRQPPDWYSKLRLDSQAVKAARNNTRKYGPTMTKLQGIKAACKACEEASPKTLMAEMTKRFDTLRNLIHDVEFLTVDQYLIRSFRMLENRTGLPRIFDPKFTEGVDYPWDLKADAEQLYTRWCREIFSIDILRGIKRAFDGQRNSDKIDPDYKQRLYANYYGQGNLINGQWWPTQLCTLRDGAHGSAQGGIFGEKDRGTYSIVLSGGHKYGDEDHGEEIWYTGTDSKDETPTENTKRLIESCEMPENEKEPVRVIRSWNLGKENKYRPEGGFRYDGLYDVIESQSIGKEKGMYKFFLVRRGGQDPIRYEGVEMRPTQQELKEYKKLQQENKL